MSVVGGGGSPLYAKVVPRRPVYAIYDNVVPIAKGARKTLQANPRYLDAEFESPKPSFST